MMNKADLSAMTLLLLVVTLGCVNQTAGPSTAGGDLFKVSVTPTKISAGGGATQVLLNLSNTWEGPLFGTTAQIGGFDTAVFVPDTITPVGLGDVYPKTVGTNIWSVAVNQDLSFKQQFKPKVTVCFDYPTNFYWDAAFVPQNYTKDVSDLQKGVTSGPIDFTIGGLQVIPVSSDPKKILNSLTFANNLPTGDMLSIKGFTLNFTAPTGVTISDVQVESGGATYPCPASGTIFTCNFLSGLLKPISGTLNLRYSYMKSGAIGERLDKRFIGNLVTHYCIEAQGTTVTVCPSGLSC